MTAINGNIDIPDFLSNDFFKKSLQNGLKTEDIIIEDVQISRASPVGENYLSIVYRAKIKYHQSSDNDSKEISLIVKSMLMSIYEISDEIDAFDREVEMYKIIFPKIEELYNNTEKFVPKYKNFNKFKFVLI